MLVDNDKKEACRGPLAMHSGAPAVNVGRCAWTVSHSPLSLSPRPGDKEGAALTHYSMSLVQPSLLYFTIGTVLLPTSVHVATERPEKQSRDTACYQNPIPALPTPAPHDRYSCRIHSQQLSRSPDAQTQGHHHIQPNRSRSSLQTPNFDHTCLAGGHG